MFLRIFRIQYTYFCQPWDIKILHHSLRKKLHFYYMFGDKIYTHNTFFQYLRYFSYFFVHFYADI